MAGDIMDPRPLMLMMPDEPYVLSKSPTRSHYYTYCAQ